MQMPVYKDQNKGTWFVVLRYTDWTGERKNNNKTRFQNTKRCKKYETDFLEKNQKI